MNEIANGTMGVTSIGFTIVLFVAGVIAWFFVNRASVKASQQVKLLESLLEEQKRQNALLLRLADAVISQEKADSDQPESKNFTHLIPER